MTVSPGRFCEQCGARLEPAQEFCEQCGTRSTHPSGPVTPSAPGLGAAPSTPPQPAAGPSPGGRTGGAQPLLAAVLVGAVVGVAIIWWLVNTGRIEGIVGGAGPSTTASPMPSPTGAAAASTSTTTAAVAVPSVTTTPRVTPTAVAPTSTATPTPRPATATLTPTATPRTAPPPAAGRTEISDALAAPGLVQPASCPLQDNAGEFAEGAFRITIRGRCREGSTFADLTVRAPNATVSDGEVSVQARVASGSERAFFYLGGRVGSDGSGGYGAYFFPSESGVGIRRWSSDARPGAALGQETNSVPFVDGWNTLALRFRGASMWLMLNDIPLIKVDDDAFDRGAIQFGVGRTGDVGDTAPVSVLFRDLRVRALADAASARVTTEQAGIR